MDLLDKLKKVLCFPAEFSYLSPWIAREDTIAKRLITMAVIGAEKNNDKALVYVKGREKREWLAGILDSDNSIIETLVWMITKI